MKINSLKTLLVHELKDLYSAEKQFSKALPKMAKAATNPELQKAFIDHLEETKNQITRLDEVFGHFDFKPSGEHCDAAEGLVKEGDGAIEDIDAGAVRDAALIGAGQRVEHYEIAGYGAACAHAELLGMTKVAELLGKTLKEEGQADKHLQNIAKKVNSEAMKNG